MTNGFGFPFGADTAGRVRGSEDDDARIRSKIVQVLFTSPGERVNQPEFGCGLFNLLFEPSNEVLFAAVEFSVGQALTRWLGDEIRVDGVDAQRDAEDEALLTVEVAYTKKSDLNRTAVRVQFRS